MILSEISDSELPKSSFIHVYGRTQDSKEYSDFVLNVDKINFIRQTNDDKTFINLSDMSIQIDFDYYEFIELFLNKVNLLFHLNPE